MKRGVLVVVGAWLLTACLPGDTRPEPGNVLTSLSGSPATRQGFTSVDGWTVTFERVLIAAGPTQLGDDCDKFAEYSEPGYDRVVDASGPPGQKLSIMFGLGQCDMDFELSPPSEDAVLGSGVSADDKTFMRTPGSDAYVANDGIVLHVVGSATDGSRNLSFSWDVRQSLFFRECSATVDGVIQPGLDLRGGQGLRYDLLLETEGLFRDDVDRDTGQLRFAPFADADADQDGTLRLDELAAVSLEDLRATAPYGGGGSDVSTLRDYLYRVSWPTLLRFRGTGSCTVSLEED